MPYPKVFFTVSDIVSIKHSGDSRYKAIQALMKTTINEDLLTGSKLNKDVEDHHIYPYSLYRSGLHKNKLNSIANKILLSKDTNRDLLNTNPDKYLVDLSTRFKTEGNTQSLSRRFTNCFIPYVPDDLKLKEKLSQENFDQFLNDRASMILKRIQEEVGDSWQTIDIESNLEDDETVS